MAGLSYFTDNEEDFILDYVKNVANGASSSDAEKEIAKDIIIKIEGQYGTKRMSGRG